MTPRLSSLIRSVAWLSVGTLLIGILLPASATPQRKGAAFGPDEIELTQEGTDLLVTGQKKSAEEERHLLHRGIAQRNFKQTFSVADHVKVAGAKLENGLLSIDLVREIPEQMKPRRIEIGSAAKKAQGRSRTISRSRSTRIRRRKASLHPHAVIRLPARRRGAMITENGDA